VDDEVEMPVSFNGKVRFKLKVATDLAPNEIEQIARTDARTTKQIGDATIRKVIVVPGRIVNIVFG
jgi:leucyl-tRNA synthetase